MQKTGGGPSGTGGYRADQQCFSEGQLGSMKAGDPGAAPMQAHDEPIVWTHCYDDSWKGVITPESFSHPAKFARGLIRRIYAYLLDSGLLKPGDTILDPFGGVSLGALDAMAHGCRWVGCELEPKFVALGRENLALWQRDWGFTGATLLQGDSRQLRRVLTEAGQACVSSPPYASDTIHIAGNKKILEERPNWKCGQIHSSGDGYGNTDGQLSAMPPGTPPAAAVSSPPYASGEKGHPSLGSVNQDDWGKDGRDIAGRRGKDGSYGTTPGQLGAMPEGVVSSPPYASGVVHDGNGIDPAKLTGNKPGPNSQAKAEGYGDTDGNLGNMPAGCVSSPPWENQEPSHAQGSKFTIPHDTTGLSTSCEYGTSAGQIGNTTGATFWDAARLIMIELAAILSPGAPAVWIVKSFVRKGQIVDFPAQWRQLCEACGFTHHQTIHASLVKEKRERSLFGGEEVTTKSRMSFFRRLHSKKHPHLAINHETVLVMRRSGLADAGA